MSMGCQAPCQDELIVPWQDLPRSLGRALDGRLQQVLSDAGFDAFVESVCLPHYGSRGARSIPPGRYFRMHMVGYFEGIDSERGLEWRCSDSLSLRAFLQLEAAQRVPDRSWLSKTRSRLPAAVHERVFEWVLARVAERGLVRGARTGVDASTMEANAALRSIRRRADGASYREMPAQLARASGIETPTAEDLVRFDRQRKGKKRLSNKEWASATDPEARIAKMKDGRTRLACKPEHAVDLDTGAAVAVEIHAADAGDTETLPDTLERAEANMAAAGAAPAPDAPAECVADKGCHSRDVLKCMDGGPWKARIAEPSRAARARRAGAATPTRAGQFATTARGCGRRSAAKPCASAARLSNGRSHTLSTAAVCAGHGCAGARLSASAISSASPRTISGSQCVVSPARGRRERPQPATGQRFRSFRATTAP